MDAPAVLAAGLEPGVLGGTKPPAMALAAGIILPLPWMAAFYRSAAVLADRDDLDLSQLMAKARKLAGLDQRQGWGILLLLAILYLILLLNRGAPARDAAAAGAHAHRLRIRLQPRRDYYVSNPLFWLAALSLAWMVFDPFMQAVYCVRSFHLESRGTGEDLRAPLAIGAHRGSRSYGIGCDSGALQAQAISRESRPIHPPHLAVARIRLATARLPLRSAAGHVPWLVAVTDRLADSVQQRPAQRRQRHRAVAGLAAREILEPFKNRQPPRRPDWLALEHLCADCRDARAGGGDRVAIAASAKQSRLAR